MHCTVLSRSIPAFSDLRTVSSMPSTPLLDTVEMFHLFVLKLVSDMSLTGQSM